MALAAPMTFANAEVGRYDSRVVALDNAADERRGAEDVAALEVLNVHRPVLNTRLVALAMKRSPRQLTAVWPLRLVDDAEDRGIGMPHRGSACSRGEPVDAEPSRGQPAPHSSPLAAGGDGPSTSGDASESALPTRPTRRVESSLAAPRGPQPCAGVGRTAHWPPRRGRLDSTE